MSDDQIAKSYIWNGGKCYFVSTIERDSSAMDGPRRYSETLVWEWDAENMKRGDFVFQSDDITGSIGEHISTVQKIHSAGEFWNT